jgi:hypothetical protein
VQPKLPYVVLVEKGLSLLCAKLAPEADGPGALGSRAPGRPPLAKVSTGTVDFGHFPLADHAGGCGRRTRHRTRCAAALAWHIPHGRPWAGATAHAANCGWAASVRLSEAKAAHCYALAGKGR